MDTIRFLLSIILKIAFGLFFLVVVFWLVGFLFPAFKPSNLFSGELFKNDWLPTPRNYAGLLAGRSSNGENGKVYEPGPSYNGYGTAESDGMPIDWVVYSDSGTKIIKGGQSGSQANNQIFTGNTTAGANRSMYVRNLSIYEGGNISYGTVFTGEARDTMFANGIFPITVQDQYGKTVALSEAINTGMWAAPGWVRFQATIRHQLPRNTMCELYFYSAKEPLRVGIPVRCN